jgi:phytol kinase
MENYLFILLLFAVTYPLPMVVQPVLVRFLYIENHEIKRKISHLCYGLLFCFYPLLGWSLLIPILGLILVLISQSSFLFGDNLFKRLSARMGSKGSNPQSAIAFYIGFLLLYILFAEQYIIYLASALVLTFGDAFAAIVGQTKPLRTYKIVGTTKSLGGSLAFFITTFLAVALCFSIGSALQPGLAILFALVIAAILTFIENITPYRMDNLTILLATAYLYQQVLLCCTA